MLILKWAVIAVVVLVLAALAAGQAGLLRGKAPGDLGVRNGRLKLPSPTENSVSSQAALYPDHPQRRYAEIAPLPLRGDARETLDRIERVVRGMPGAEVVRRDADYLYAQFTTRWMRYVDDVEFWADPPNGVIQVRSASRIGRGDLGTNRARLEAIRAGMGAGDSGRPR